MEGVNDDSGPRLGLAQRGPAQRDLPAGCEELVEGTRPGRPGLLRTRRLPFTWRGSQAFRFRSLRELFRCLMVSFSPAMGWPYSPRAASRPLRGLLPGVAVSLFWSERAATQGNARQRKARRGGH